MRAPSAAFGTRGIASGCAGDRVHVLRAFSSTRSAAWGAYDGAARVAATITRRDPGDGGAPNCPNCLKAFGVEVRMRGPEASPMEDATGRFFVCGRCNHTMRDRRGHRPSLLIPIARP
jgi:hypothetical protein